MRVLLDEVVRLKGGPVVPGARLYVYERGTTTQVTGYTTEGGATTVSYPLTADVEGRFPAAWYAPGSYDLYSPDDDTNPTQPWEAISGTPYFSGDPSDPDGTITIDSPTNRGLAAPYKRASINFWDDGNWKWQVGLDVGEGAYPAGDGERADLVLGFHRWVGGGGSRDIIYLTDEEYPRTGFSQNWPIAVVDIATLVPGRIGHRVSGPTTVATTLNGAHTLPVTPITVASTTGFPDSGQIVVGGWLCSYTGKTATTFTGVTTAAAATVANGAAVTNQGWLTRLETGAGDTVGGAWYDGKLAVGFASREPANLIELDAGTTPARGIGFGGDSPQIVLYRSDVGKAKLQGSLVITGAGETALEFTGGLGAGLKMGNVKLYQGASSRLDTDADVLMTRSTRAQLRLFGAGDGNTFSVLELGSDEATDKTWFVSHEQDSSRINELWFKFNDGSTSTVLKLGKNKLGFFSTAPVAKPTGVAVTAAGVHAALVTLGLIAA